MLITIRHTPDCPNTARASDYVRRALREAGMQAALSLEEVAGPEEAERLHFTGSPTILVDGSDPFGAADAPVAFACRFYVTPEGRDTVPTVAQLRAAIEGRRR